MSINFDKTWNQARDLALEYPRMLQKTYQITIIPQDKLKRLYNKAFMISAKAIAILAIIGFCELPTINNAIVFYLMLTPLPFLLSVMIYGACVTKRIKNKEILAKALEKDIKKMNKQDAYLRLPQYLKLLNNVIKLHASLGHFGQIIKIQYITNFGKKEFNYLERNTLIHLKLTTVRVLLNNFLDDWARQFFYNTYQKNIEADDLLLFESNSVKPLAMKATFESNPKKLFLILRSNVKLQDLTVNQTTSNSSPPNRGQYTSEKTFYLIADGYTFAIPYKSTSHLTIRELLEKFIKDAGQHCQDFKGKRVDDLMVVTSNQESLPYDSICFDEKLIVRLQN